MKKIILFVFALFAFNSVAANAQQTQIAPEKKKIIGEIISVTKADQKTEETIKAMLDQMAAAYPTLVKETLAKSSGLTAARKTSLESEMIKRNASFSAKFNERLRQRVNFREYVEQTFYPLYDKFFTEGELKDLLAFYKTPTGQKLNEVTPQLAAESIRLSQEILTPKIAAIVNEIIQEDIEEIQKKPR